MTSSQRGRYQMRSYQTAKLAVTAFGQVRDGSGWPGGK